MPAPSRTHLRKRNPILGPRRPPCRKAASSRTTRSRSEAPVSPTTTPAASNRHPARAKTPPRQPPRRRRYRNRYTSYRRSGGKQFECRIVRCNLGECFRGRSCRHGEIALHLALETVEIGLEDRKFFRVVQRAQAESFPPASSLQSDFSGSFRVAHPLRASARSRQVALAV